MPAARHSGLDDACGVSAANTVNLLSLSEKEIRTVRGSRIAMIFQEPMSSLNPVFTIGDQIMEAILLHQSVNRQAARAIAIRSLTDVGITDPERRLGAYPHQFSGGMRQRVMIAMALACKPSLLLADEPTTALDVTIQRQILELLRELKTRTGMAIMLITHDLGVVSENADAVCVMYAGRVVEYAAVADLFAAPLHPYTRGLLACIPSLASRVDRLTTIADLMQQPEARHIPGKPDLHPWWPGHTPPDGLTPNDSVLFEVHPNHWVACWRTHDLASHTPRPPDITPILSPVN
jgi:ABC-type dipeptide/oligopeptide/nickel transport system ATPase component